MPDYDHLSMTIVPSAPATPEPTSVPATAVRAARRSKWWKTLLLYTAIAALTLGSAAWALGLWHADLHTPFAYDDDAAFYLMLIKLTLTEGAFAQTSALGAPGGMSLGDFPVVDNLVMGMIKGLSIFSSDPAFLCNLFFLLTFPLVAWSTLYVVRQLGLSTWPALLVSYLYTLLPFHFFRGTGALFLSAYFLIPPAILIMWWISSGILLAKRWRLVFGLVTCVLLGCNMLYYPFFACFLFLVAAVIAATRSDYRHACAGGLCIATVTAVVLLNFLPAFLYSRAHGHNSTGKRYSFEAEMFGLKIVQLLLPTTGHRIPAFDRVKRMYNNTHSLVNENDAISLGIIGGLGFVTLTGWLLFARRRVVATPAPDPTDPPDLLSNGATNQRPQWIELTNHLSIFNGAALLLGTVGGFSVLFAILVTPQIRAYNRIGIFIAFFALLAVGVGLEWMARRWVTSRRSAIGFAIFIMLIGWLGYLDQVGADAYHDWLSLKRTYRNDRQFFARLQSAVPPNSMIFELPFEMFPEYGSTMNRMTEYSLFRPYLHTAGLHWSYGAIKGRPGAEWESDTAARPVEQMIGILQQTGFAAIYVDRFGYADDRSIMGQLQYFLGAPLVDAAGRYALFFLPALTIPAPSPANFLLPLPAWTDGFYGAEYSPDHAHFWHWCDADGELWFFNETGADRHLRVQASFRTGNPEVATVQIDAPAFHESVRVDPALRTEWSRTLNLPPGTTTVHFHCDASPLDTGGADSRKLIWRVDDFKSVVAD